MARPLIRQILDTWLKARNDLDPNTLSQDFLFDHTLEEMTREEFLERLRHTGTWSSVAELVVVDGPDGAAAVVEATDDVTGLCHRLAWVVTYHGEKVRRITVTSSRIP